MTDKNNRVIPFIVLCLFILINQDLFSQESNLGIEVKKLSDYIASNHFAALKLKMDDPSRADSLFKEALLMTHGNFNEALFALTFTVVPYNLVPIKIPMFPIIINYPLVSAIESVFEQKNKNLPKYLFFDSPEDNYGDKDKLAHFFGAAFLSYSGNIFDLSDLIGYFVEVFEQDFKVQSSIDPRDLHADTLGDIFGRLLKKNKEVLPSQVIFIKTLFYCRYDLP